MGRRKPDSYDLHAKNVFLTFSALPPRLTLEALRDRLLQKVTPKDFTFGLEIHPDRKKKPYHIHGLLEFEERFRTRDPRFFDVNYYNQVYHPNVQPARSKRKVLDYVIFGS